MATAKTYTTTKIDEKLNAKANASHSHSIGNVSGLQLVLDGKQSTLVSGTNIKTVNGNSLLGSGDIVISASVPTASDTTAGIYKVMAYNPVSTSNWNADDVVLTGRALEWLVAQGVLDKSGSSSSSNAITSITRGGYHGPYSASTTNTSLKDLLGGNYGVFYVIWGVETRDHGHISVQQKTTFYTDYDCVAYSSGDAGYWGKSYLSITVFVPANTTYYLWGQNVEKVYINYFAVNK